MTILTQLLSLPLILLTVLILLNRCFGNDPPNRPLLQICDMLKPHTYNWCGFACKLLRNNNRLQHEQFSPTAVGSSTSSIISTHSSQSTTFSNNFFMLYGDDDSYGAWSSMVGDTFRQRWSDMISEAGSSSPVASSSIPASSIPTPSNLAQLSTVPDPEFICVPTSGTKKIFIICQDHTQTITLHRPLLPPLLLLHVLIEATIVTLLLLIPLQLSILQSRAPLLYTEAREA